MFKSWRLRRDKPPAPEAGEAQDTVVSRLDASLGDSVFGASTGFGPSRPEAAGPQEAAASSRRHRRPEGAAEAEDGLIALPLLGRRTQGAHLRILVGGLVLCLLGTVTLVGLGWRQAGQPAPLPQDNRAQALAVLYQLGTSLPQALQGQPSGLEGLDQGADALLPAVAGLRSLPASASGPVDAGALTALAEAVTGQAQAVLRHRGALVQIAEGGTALESTVRQWVAQAQEALSLMPPSATAPEWAAVVRVHTAAQALHATVRAVQRLQGPDGAALGALPSRADGLLGAIEAALEGQPAARLPAVRDGRVREFLVVLRSGIEDAQAPLRSLAAHAPAATATGESAIALQREWTRLRQGVDAWPEAVGAGTGGSQAWAIAALVLVLLALWLVAGMARLQGLAARLRQAQAERLQTEAQAKQREAKRINDANQAAILRLMNELQLVAEGDLTHQATVTEDITGAIADSVNYTVEELRSLVGHVQSTATRVTRTTAEVEGTSIELLAASSEQLREIRETGQAVLDMAQRITQISTQAQSSADVARQALQAAESGAQAVQDTIGGMNTIRGQIQDTAKRIKRLGESSQEIGEITELISGITEQTNVLALNAAIQAASAGEAGRGFAVVAEEVQRLAERSADATRQIAALVRAIQTDTQDTVLAMERSTREVVEGTRLSDNAGAALADIDRLSRRAAELIEQIAISSSREAELAGQTGASIQHIFAVTEQMGEGTRSTVRQVHDLARIADELRESVARFKIA